MEKELGRGDFNTIHKTVDISTGDIYITKKFHHDNWKKEVKILKNISHVNMIIDLIINLYLTFHKKVYCEIYEFLERVKTFINNKISISWKFNLSRFHY